MKPALWVNEKYERYISVGLTLQNALLLQMEIAAEQQTDIEGIRWFEYGTFCLIMRLHSGRVQLAGCFMI